MYGALVYYHRLHENSGEARTGSKTSQYKKLRYNAERSAGTGAVCHVLREGHGFLLFTFCFWE